jgi:hypothetical protein
MTRGSLAVWEFDVRLTTFIHKKSDMKILKEPWKDSLDKGFR